MSGMLGNPAVSNLVLSLGAMQLVKKIPQDTPEAVNYLRLAYVSSQLISFAVFYYVTLKIKKKNDLTVLKYVQPSSPMAQEKTSELITTTVKDYDLAETGKAMKNLFVGIAFMCFLHGYMKYTAPLFIQGLMTLKSTLESNTTKLYIWGAKPEGPLSRPFKAGGGMMDALTGGSAGPQTDAASIKAAEKAGGKKE